MLQAGSVGTIICATLFTLPWLDEFGSSRRDMMLTIALLQIGAGILALSPGEFPAAMVILAASMVLALALLADTAWQLADLRHSAPVHDPYGYFGKPT